MRSGRGGRSRIGDDLTLDVSWEIVSGAHLRLLWSWSRHSLCRGKQRTGAGKAGQHQRGRPN